MKTEIIKLEKKLAEMREQLASFRFCPPNPCTSGLAAQISDCEKMLIHARILMLQNDYGEHLYKCK